VADILALENLYNGVRSYFETNGWGKVYQPFGWREPAQQQAVQDRIAWVPGDRSGFVGEIVGTTQPGGVPRYLATLNEVFHVVVSTWADKLDPENELFAWRTTRILWGRWYEAAFHVAQGTFTIQRQEWVQIHKERRSGTALIATITIQSPMYSDEWIIIPVADAPLDSPARFVVDVEELDVTEQVISGPAAPIAVAATTGPITLSGEQPIDGIPLVSGAIALVKDEPDKTRNGLYVVDVGAWVRTADVLAQGFFVTVAPGGTANGDTGWRLITSDPVVVGVSPLVFELYGPFRVTEED
jgi:hypothetical protein